MQDKICRILNSYGIELCSPVPLSSCNIVRAYKLKNNGFDQFSDLTAYMIAVPYFTEHKIKNISSYAVPRDYHAYFKDLFGKVIPVLQQTFPSYIFAGYSDNSPIDERSAAAMSGIGIIGENGMLITEKYSSFVFLGEIITNMPIPHATALPIKKCISCGKCKDICPMKNSGICLSELTQKKGELTKEEEDIMAKYGYAWGCDLCQNVCPHTTKAINEGTIYTNIDFFRDSLIPKLSSEMIISMSDTDFYERAYSWRKRETILRNLKILEENDKTNN